MANIRKDTRNTNLLTFNLNSLLFGSFAIAFVSSCYYTLFQYSPYSAAASIGSAFFVLLLYQLSGNPLYAGIIKMAYIWYIDFFLLPVTWFVTEGSKGPMLYYAILFIVITSLLTKSKKECFLPLVIVAEVLILWLTESYFAGLIHSLSCFTNVKDRIPVHFVLAGLILCLFLYLNWRNSAEVHSRMLDFSMIDDLTKLFNRRYLFDSLNALYDEASRTSKHYILIMLDIDNFKQINDTYGHHTGDEVLRDLGKIIKESIRKYDIGARYGGDEFAIVLPDANAEDKAYVIDRINEAFEIYARRFPDVYLGLSFGYSGDNTLTVEELVREADRGLYESKDARKSAKHMTQELIAALLLEDSSSVDNK